MIKRPGLAPRKVPWKVLYRAMDAILQIMYIIVPLVILAGVIGRLVFENKDDWYKISSGFVTFGIIFACIYLFMTWSVWSVLKNGKEIKATITFVSRSKDLKTMGGYEFQYSYSFQGKTYQDTMLTQKSLGFEIGDELWIIADQKLHDFSHVWIDDR